MSNLFAKIAHWVHGAATKVSDAFVAIFGADAAHQFASGALAILKTDVGQVALDAVEAVESLALDPAQKHAAAFDQIVSEFKSKGIAAADSTIHLLIELAVASLKNHIFAL